MTGNIGGTVYLGVALIALLGFGVVCSVATHRGATWLTDDVVGQTIFAILVWPATVVTLGLWYGARAAHAGIGYLVRPRAPVVRDAEQTAAEQEVERLLKERP